MHAIAYPHIMRDEKGFPTVDGTGMKVVFIVLDQIAYHWNAEEIQRQHPILSLAQIHSALAYYYDHQEEIDQDIQRRMGIDDEIARQFADSPIRLKLLKLKADRLKGTG